MTVDSNTQCEVRMSNIVQKSRIFYEHNTVTNRICSNKTCKPHLHRLNTPDLLNKKAASGKVLIIVNEIVENRFSKEAEEQKEARVKELYIYLTMKNKNKSQEEAEKQWEENVQDNPEEYKF